MTTAINYTIFAGAQFVQSVRGLNCTIGALQTAIEEGNLANIELQQAAVKYYLETLNSNTSVYGACYVYLGRVLEDLDILSRKFERKDVLELRDKILADGQFPDFEKHAFDQLRATEEEIAAAIEEVGLATGESLPDEFSVVELCSHLPHAFAQIDFKELLPDWLKQLNLKAG